MQSIRILGLIVAYGYAQLDLERRPINKHRRAEVMSLDHTDTPSHGPTTLTRLPPQPQPPPTAAPDSG